LAERQDLPNGNNTDKDKGDELIRGARKKSIQKKFGGSPPHHGTALAFIHMPLFL